MKRKTPEKAANHVLGVLSENEAKEFMMDSLNLPWAVSYPDHRSTFNVWLRRWHRWFTIRHESNTANGWESKQLRKEQLERFAPKLRTALRRIWYEKDARLRDWYFYRLRDQYHRMIVRAENPDLIDPTDPGAIDDLVEIERLLKARGDDSSQRHRLFERAMGFDTLEEEPPRLCPFEAAVYWLQLNQKLMVYCEGPMCPAPYFFRTEKGQKYCSSECADPARRAAKLEWWNKNRKNKVAK